MKILLALYLTLAVPLLTKSVAQSCHDPEYTLLSYIIKTQNIRYVSREASPAPLMCEYTESTSASKYAYFTGNVLTFNGLDMVDKEAMVRSIDSLRFEAFLEDNAAYEWDAVCIPATARLFDPGNPTITAATQYFISRPLLTEDLRYGIVYIRKSNGLLTGGTGFISVYRKDERGGWEFYAHGGCMTYK